MHELGIAEPLLDVVRRRADGRAVAALRLQVGALHRVVEEALQTAWDLVSGGTEAEGARVEVTVLPVRCRCGACGEEAEGDDLVVVCPSCGGTTLSLVGGEELLLESLTFAEANAQAGS